MDLEADNAVDLNPITNPAPADTPEVKQSTPETAETPEKNPEPKEEPIPKGVQKRIDRAVRQKYEAEARAKMLEERVAAMEARQFQQPQQEKFVGNHKSVDNGAPKIEDYDDFAEFQRATARHEYKILREQEREEERIAAEQRKEKEAEIAAHKKWAKQLETVTANDEMPDFEDVLSSSDVIMTPIMQRAIKESDIGPKLAYYLAKNPDEAERIATMDRENTIRTIGRLEERLETQKKTPVPTSMPEPIKPLSTRTTVTKDPGKMSDAEYSKWRAQGRKRA